MDLNPRARELYKLAVEKEQEAKALESKAKSIKSPRQRYVYLENAQKLVGEAQQLISIAKDIQETASPGTAQSSSQ